VVKRVPVDPQYYSGDAGVEQRHEFSLSFSIGSPARASPALESRNGSGVIGLSVTDFI
jgi:hypothetical protein